MPLALAERAAAHGIAIVRAYGSTEHPSVTGCAFDDPADKRHGTDGAPMTGVEIRLVDDDGVAVAAGRRRRDLVARPRPVRRLHRSRRSPPTRSTPTAGTARGDMGVLDADGFLTITDRVKDVIIRGGENISAAEIEEAIAALPQVAEVAVVAAPDERLGEHACAVVRLAPGASSIDLRRHHRRARAHRPGPPEVARGAARSYDFPRTAAGKVRKVDLRRQLRAEQPDTRLGS